MIVADGQLAARVLLGVVFLGAVSGKLAGRSEFLGFAGSLRKLRLVPAKPPTLAVAVAAVVVVCEAVTVGLLVVPATDKAGLLAAAVLLAGFTVSLAKVVWQGLRVPCQCFGPFDRPIGPVHVVRNLVLTIVAVVAAVLEPSLGAVEPVTTVSVSVFAALVGLVIVRFDAITHRLYGHIWSTSERQS